MIVNEHNVDILTRIILLPIEYSGGASGHSHELPNPIKTNL